MKASPNTPLERPRRPSNLPPRSHAHIRWTNATQRFLLDVSIGIRKEKRMFDRFDPRDRDGASRDDHGVYDSRRNDDPRERDNEWRERDRDRDRGAQRSGRGSARWCPGGPICCRPFRLTVPHSPLHHSVSDPRHLGPDRRISRIRLTAKASSIEVMDPFGRCALSRSRTRGGTPGRDSTNRTRRRYSTASSRIPCACAAWPRIAVPCAQRGT